MRTPLLLALLHCCTMTAAQTLTAEEAVRIAVERNHGIRLARVDARAAALQNTAGNAGMLPAVNAIGSYSVDNSSTKQTFFSGETREADNADQRVLDGAVQLNWTLFDGLAMFATKDRLDALELIGRSRLRQRIEATVYDVLSTYYLLVQLRQALDVQREGARISRDRLAIAEAAARIGSDSGLAVVQARLDLSADSAAVLDLALEDTRTRARLNALLGRDPAAEAGLTDTIPAAGSIDPARTRQAMLASNSALQEARLQRIAADLSVKELRGALLPRIDVFANYGYTKSTSAVGVLQSNQALGPDYGARVSIPLFRGGQARSATDMARLAREQADLELELAGLDLNEAFENAWGALNAANQRVLLEQGNLSGARTQSDVALESYRLGAITAVELREVQQGLIAAEQRLLLARYEAKLAELQLRWLSGELIQG